MDTHKLASFVDLAQTLNYTETAARRFTTQATISKQIKSLEQALNVKLVDRTHRAITLTPAGQLVLPYAQQIVAATHRMEAAVQAQSVQAQKQLVVRTIPSIGQYRAFNLLAAFSKQHPEIDMQFTEAETATLIPALDDESADVIFTRLFQTPAKKYAILAEETDHFVALFPATHPLAKAQTVTIADLADESLLLLSNATGLYAPVRRLMAEAGVYPQISYTGQRIDLVAGMVNRGMGVAIMMAQSVPLAAFPDVVAVPITPVINSRLAFMKLAAHRTPATDMFWRFVAAQA